MLKRNSEREDRSNARQSVRLGLELEESLSAYASAALAAGVSLLALTKSTEAKIVYTQADVKIAINGGPVPIDLNHDGIADFFFSNRLGSTSNAGHGTFGTLLVGPGSGSSRNEFWGRGVMSGNFEKRFASALHPSLPVRSNKSYFRKSPKGVMAGFVVGYSYLGYLAFSSTSGQWLYTKHRYLGLRFMVSGQVHYGWARVAVTLHRKNGNAIAATLTGYAYETIPNKPIITGKTKGPDVITLGSASLGHLAQGASAISTWRAKK